MKVISILKAGQTRSEFGTRLALPVQAEAQASADEPGSWISDVELAALKARHIEQGRRECQQDERREAQRAARLAAEKQAKAWLDQELKERQDRHQSEQAERWRGLAKAVAAQMQLLREQLQAEVTEWTFAAIARLQGQRSPEDVAAAVRQVLAESRLDGNLTVKLHPLDLASLNASGATRAEGWPEGLTFVADTHVSTSGCLIESDIQTLDARLEVQLALVRKALDDLRRQRGQKVS